MLAIHDWPAVDGSLHFLHVERTSGGCTAPSPEMMKSRQAQADLQRIQREKDALAAENDRLKGGAVSTPAAVPLAIVSGRGTGRWS